MLTSIRKATTSLLAKILIAIIILPFLFWGMGDVFRTGNQNIVVTIDSEKVSAQNFVEYVNRLNLSKQQRDNIGKTDLLDKILSDYVGKKIIELEIIDQGVMLSNQSLKKIITTDETFKEDNKFSRTKYEKFLLESGISAPVFEKSIAVQEKKRQLLTFLSQGVNLPGFMIEQEYANENQIKKIQYLELDTLYKNYLIPEKEIKKTYSANKILFTQDFKKINYTELLPNNLTGQKNFNESFFKKIDEIENAVLDGGNMSNFVKEFNLSLVTIAETNRLKKDKSGKDISKIDDKLFEKFFSPNILNKVELINFNNKYYLSEVLNMDQVERTLKDTKIRQAIISQLKIKHIIESNKKIVKDMFDGTFNKERFKKFSKDNNLEIKNITLKDIKNETVFNSGIIKEIFKINDGNFQLITDSLLTRNFIIFSEKTERVPFSKSAEDYEQYKAKAKLNLANQIYSSFDETMNSKYNVKINQKVLSRIKNTL
jgi:peptidyl-prolyl cis-trans isomerase D